MKMGEASEWLTKVFNRMRIFMVHTHDPRVTSVTYRVPYPVEEIKIDIKSSDRRIKNKELVFSRTWTEHLEKFEFIECRVKYNKDACKEFAHIAKSKFINCRFVSCFLGGTYYKDVTFTNCHFISCDFYNTRFENCNFTGCTFENCTAWVIDFQNTVVSATSFMDGVRFPLSNYVDVDDVTLAKNLLSHHKTCLDIACNLIKSAADTYDSTNIDIAIYAHKLALYDYYKAKIRFNWKTVKLREFKKLAKISIDIIQVIYLKAINLLSNGGTSFKKLLWMSFVFVFVLGPAVLYLFTDIKVKISNKEIFLGQEMNYPLLLVSSIEAIMAFGYDRFEPSSLQDKYLLALFPIAGFFLFAFFVHALIKKVFR